ncbi:MAG: hypothetical protein JWN85_3158 [Gammaproteobacteria bacterium]|nr:hypothetical protein [Gammaproteobacteria bacterium]
MKKLTALVAVAAFSTSAGTIARADTNFEPRSETVQFAELDTADVAGAAVLYRRISSAARSVCRDLEPGRSLARRQPYANCVHAALARAVAEIDRPAVTAYAAAHWVLPGEASIKIARNN